MPTSTFGRPQVQAGYTGGKREANRLLTEHCSEMGSSTPAYPLPFAFQFSNSCFTHPVQALKPGHLLQSLAILSGFSQAVCRGAACVQDPPLEPLILGNVAHRPPGGALLSDPSPCCYEVQDWGRAKSPGICVGDMGQRGGAQRGGPPAFRLWQLKSCYSWGYCWSVMRAP